MQPMLGTASHANARSRAASSSTATASPQVREAFCHALAFDSGKLSFCSGMGFIQIGDHARPQVCAPFTTQASSATEPASAATA